MHDENDVLTDDELVVTRASLKKSKYACLYKRIEFPCGFCVLNKNDGGREKSNNMRETSWTRCSRP